MLQLMNNGHLNWELNQKRSGRLKDRKQQQRDFLMNVLRREGLKDQNLDPTHLIM